MILTATTNKAMTFTRHVGQANHDETLPAGTTVTLDQDEMESNPQFFNVQVVGVHNTQTYVSLADITPA